MLLSWGNFDHGAYKSGDKLEAKKSSFERYLSFQGEEYFSSFQESIAHDRGDFVSYDDGGSIADTMMDWLSSRALRNRGVYEPCLNSNIFFRADSHY